MGLWADTVLPRAIDKLLDNREMRALRRRVTEGLSGVLLEIGFGSGLNVELYPREVTRVLAVDPAVVGRKLAAPRIARAGLTVEYIGLDGQRLSLPDESVDCALSTFTLCTIPDAELALREVFRVLKPGGPFHFAEHGLAPDPGVARWQHRIEPLNRRVAGGCHLTRQHDDLVRRAGFDVERIETEYGNGPKPYSFHYVGVARKPG